MTRKSSDSGRWLLLIHQLPPKPDYFRVKIWRRLQGIGAVAIKNSVYVLPFNDEALEDFQWLRRDITAGGGEATVCRASFVDGMSDRQMEALFRPLADHPAALHRPVADGTAPLNKRGRTWVTRPDVHVDRIASAWLIRRFIDPKARFAFGEPRAGMVRFDMFEGDYTHEGDRCTFETLVKRFGLDKDSALRAIGEMVHDLDCKDGKFERRETPGFERLIAGVVKRHAQDDARITRGAELLDTLYESFPAAQQRSRSN
jgi:hypothetical protein